VSEQAHFVEQLSKPRINGAQVVIVIFDLLQQGSILLFRECLLPFILLHLPKYGIFLEVLARPHNQHPSVTCSTCLHAVERAEMGKFTSISFSFSASMRIAWPFSSFSRRLRDGASRSSGGSGARARLRSSILAAGGDGDGTVAAERAVGIGEAAESGRDEVRGVGVVVASGSQRACYTWRTPVSVVIIWMEMVSECECKSV